MHEPPSPPVRGISPAPVSPRPAAGPGSCKTDRMFEAFVCEVHTAALNVAIVASAANALGARAISGIGREMVDNHLPRDTGTLQTLRRQLTEADARIDDLMFVDEFLAGLERGLVELEQYFADRARYGAKRALVIHQKQLPEAWQQISHLAHLAIRELSVPLHLRLPEPYGENSNVLARLLAETKRGGSPCIDSYGLIFSPPMPQQRRSPRRLLCQPCVVQTGEHSAGAIVRDVSAGGMGLEQIPPLRPGEPVRVELSGGRRFDATVSWCSSRTAGVRFKTPLPAIDPLLLD